MNWLKGLVAPAAQFGQQQMQQAGMPPQGGMPQDPNMPPFGGAQNQYGVQPAMGGGQQPPQQMGGGGGLPDASQWSTGTRTQGSPAGGISGAGMGGGAVAGAGAGGGAAGALGSGTPDQRIAALEAKCVELTNDCGSLALFARTLLTMLEDNKTVTREQFMETKNRLDMLDGKLDDR